MPIADDHGQYREIMARLDGMTLRLTETRDDAREARDAATKLTERFDAQDIPRQIEALKGEMEKGFIAARTDLVNSSDKIRTDVSGHEARLKALEDFRSKLEGGAGLFSWLAKHAPWLFTVAFAGAAAVGWKDKIG